MYTGSSNFSPAYPLIRMVEFLMNTIESFRNRHEISRENAELRQQLSQYKDLSQENARLREELAHQHNQAETKRAIAQSDVTNTPQPQQYTTLPESMFEVYQPATQSPQSEPVASPLNPQENDEKAALEAQVDHYRQQHKKLLEQYEKLVTEMKRKKISSFEELAEHDKESMKVFIELARITPAMPFEGNNIGLFGLTSTGKSTVLNTILGQKIAETGVGETTTKIQAYRGTGYTLWDVPGRNDEVSYLSMEYVSFFKGLTRRLILIQATVKENSSMMKLLDELSLNYDIVFNKFDKVDGEEQSSVKEQIHKEIQEIALRKVDKLFFVSAKHPSMFSDWPTMIQHLNIFSS